MLHAPRYWWLLTPACLGQGLFFLHLAVLSISGKKTRPAPWSRLALVLGTLCGLAYAWLQSDVVLLVGQAIALALGLCIGRGEREQER